MYECECGRYKIVPFRCKSRFCGCCGYQYQKYRADKIKSVLINCKHRHIVFTIAEELRVYFLRNRNLLNLLFAASSDTIKEWLISRNKSKCFKSGMICVLHTFGRDLKWNPHIHMLISEGAVDRDNFFKRLDFIPFEMLRKRFMTTLLSKLKGVLNKYLIDKLYIEKNNGFYVYAKSKMNNSDVVNYIVRYVGRPVIAKKRILRYDKETVTFCYNRHEDNKYIEERVSSFDFIKRLVIHIPEKYFNMVRYYGIYAKKHNLYLKYNRLPKHLKRQMNLWYIRIMMSFKYNPLKCACGKYLKLTDIIYKDTA